MMMNKKQLKKEVSKKLKMLRKESGLSLRELADMSGTHASALCAIETGTRSVSLHSALKLAEALKVSIYRLVGDLEQSEQDTLNAEYRDVLGMSERDQEFVKHIIQYLVEEGF